MKRKIVFLTICFVFSFAIVSTAARGQCHSYYFNNWADYTGSNLVISEGLAFLEKSREIGEAWENVSLTGSPVTGIYDLEQFSDGNLYVAAQDNYNGHVIWRSTDGGNSWNYSTLETPNRRAQKARRLAEGSDGTIYIATKDTTVFWPDPGISGVWRTTDGVNWTVMTGLPGGGCTSVIEAPDGALIATTADDGRVWRHDPADGPEEWQEVWDTTAAAVGGVLPQPNYPDYAPIYKAACPYIFDNYSGEHCNGQPYNYYPSVYRPDRTQGLFKASDGKMFFATNSGGENNVYSGYQAVRGFAHIYMSTDGFNWGDAGRFDPPQTDADEYYYVIGTSTLITCAYGIPPHDNPPLNRTYPTWIDNFFEDQDGNIYACSTNNDPLRSWVLSPRRDGIIYKLETAVSWTDQTWNATGNLYIDHKSDFGLNDTYCDRNATFAHDGKANFANGNLWAGTSTMGNVHRSTDQGANWDFFTSPRFGFQSDPEKGDFTTIEITCNSCLYAGYDSNGEIYASRSQYHSGGYIEDTVGWAYGTSLSSFGETQGSGSYGTVTYQIADGPASFYWWYSGTWTAVTDHDASQSNPASEINDNIDSFPSPGTFYFRAYFNSQTYKGCPKSQELGSVEVCFSLQPTATPTPTLTPTASPTPTVTPTPTLTATPSITPTPSPVPSPNIELIKTICGASCGAVYLAWPCSPVNFDYQVTNTGNTDLEDIVVIDDNGSPFDPADDFIVGVVPGPVPPSASFDFQTVRTIGAYIQNTAWASSTGAGIPVSDSDTALAYTWMVIAGNDYNGDGLADPATWRCRFGQWSINLEPVEPDRIIFFGQYGDIPVPGDYDGDGSTNLAIYRPVNGLWAVRGLTRVYYGIFDTHPVPADYDGDGLTDVAVFRPSTGLWAVRSLTRVYYGSDEDLPVPGDYDGSGTDEFAVFRVTRGLWGIRGVTLTYYGRFGDYPVPADYDGDGGGDIGIFRPLAGGWAIKDITRTYFGGLGDWPQPADFSGDGTDRITIYRPGASGLWAVKDSTRIYWGGNEFVPISR